MVAPFELHRQQIELILIAWGMPQAHAERTAEVLSWADLHGVESHGISMLVEYDMRFRDGRLKMDADFKVMRESPVSVLIDGDGGMGHVAYAMAAEAAISKAKSAGIAVAAVRNSSHFGAVGYFTNLAARAGLIGMGATSAAGIRVAPTGGAEAKLGTDPWSFAAPSMDDNPFLLDMATTTVAYGKIRNKMNEGLPMPVGWGSDNAGRASTEPLDVTRRGGFMSPLGGTPEGSSYKGYGLSMMVNILSSCLSGATLITDPMHTKKPQGFDIGHFYLAIDPRLFRDDGAFESDVATFCNALRATKRVESEVPVMVAGDPQWAMAEQRMREGIPIGKGLRAKLIQVAEAAKVEWLLDKNESTSSETKPPQFDASSTAATY
ncbi:Ldh family oxidoreductase [Sinorhizobium mexicanum]|uniref:Ldh family oxidoreductase n=1 Tax=Sinorhizobium mexicanum TaxID=375549 RepID=A0A859QE73_9HYPH|nr:Ldh family oxidoreductase [Sinorhizobium mexicanum]MBP1883781.1 LDH2 family malate/lactate/ureidoglycolate dehydrogenase [Sinorhizobium mexicanum]QLL62952.1 Ldh family oxidoreductase [Sinorhizobium mexicanum]